MHNSKTLASGKYLILLLIIISAIGISCRKQETLSPEPTDITGAKVPDGFNWELTKPFHFSVQVTDNRFNDAIHVVAIYDGDGKLIAKGSARVGSPFESIANLSARIKKIYLIKTAPDNSRTTQEVELTKSDLTIPMGIASVNPAGKSSFTISEEPNPVSPNCTTGCNQILGPAAGTFQTVNVLNGNTVCLSGNFINKEITVSYGTGGGTLRICGTNVTIRAVNSTYVNREFPQNIIITSAGNVKIRTPNDLDILTIRGDLTNYGTLAIHNLTRVSHYGTLVNFGTMDHPKGVVQTTNTTTEAYYTLVNTNDSHNYGSMDMGYISFNNGDANISRFINHSVMTAWSMDVENEFINKCKLYNVHYLTIPGTFRNMENAYYNGAISLFKIPGPGPGSVPSFFKGQFLTYNNSMTICTYLNHQNGLIQQQSGSSLFKLTERFQNNNTADQLEIKGSIKVCVASGAEMLGDHISTTLSDGATLGCNLYIPIGTCNAIGNGTNTQSDTDHDGIVDALDDYPADVSKAFNINGAKGVLLFEDQWPRTGDYDLNDLVITYNYSLVTNSANKIVKVIGDYALRAAGGTYDNSLGIEFPVSRASVTGISGATLETGQPKAVAILFSSMHTELPQWNTVRGQPVSPPKNFHMEMNLSVSPGISLVDFGLGSYNPFIWNNHAGDNRGYEVHMWGRPPTSKASTIPFGTLNDNSSVSARRFYVSTNGYPWGLDLPDMAFKYPIEGANIGNAYKRMFQWVSTGGIYWHTWYWDTGDPASGSPPYSYYRNDALIFSP